jgi:hypothetical protein
MRSEQLLLLPLLLLQIYTKERQNHHRMSLALGQIRSPKSLLCDDTKVYFSVPTFHAPLYRIPVLSGHDVHDDWCRAFLHVVVVVVDVVVDAVAVAVAVAVVVAPVDVVVVVVAADGDDDDGTSSPLGKIVGDIPPNLLLLHVAFDVLHDGGLGSNCVGLDVVGGFREVQIVRDCDRQQRQHGDDDRVPYWLGIGLRV